MKNQCDCGAKMENMKIEWMEYSCDLLKGKPLKKVGYRFYIYCIYWCVNCRRGVASKLHDNNEAAYDAARLDAEDRWTNKKSVKRKVASHFIAQAKYGKRSDWPVMPEKTRLKVLRRAGNKCEDCDKHTDSLQLHHLHYDSIGREQPLDLKAICRSCHYKCHHLKVGRMWGDFYPDPEYVNLLNMPGLKVHTSYPLMPNARHSKRPTA